MEPPRPSAETGQAAAEYTGVLALVAAALAAAGAAAGLGGVADAVAGSIRTGVCIVAGGVCRPADAAAAGLAPCVVSDRRLGSGAELTVFSLRLGRDGDWTLASRSDGTVVITRTRDRSIGVAGGFGVSGELFGLELGAGGKYLLTVRDGSSWELPDAAAARRFLAADEDDRPPATWRFGDLGAELAAEAGAQLVGTMLTGVEASASQAAGARLGRGRTTLYVRARLDGPAPTVWTPAGRRTVPGPSTGDLLVELSRERGELRELAFRKLERGARDGQAVETVARLDLRVPVNRAAAERLLRRPPPWGAVAGPDLAHVVRHTVQVGTVERAVYEVRDESREIELAARLGLELGIDVKRVDVSHRLVAAHAWTGGAGPREREDCAA